MQQCAKTASAVGALGGRSSVKSCSRSSGVHCRRIGRLAPVLLHRFRSLLALNGRDDTHQICPLLKVNRPCHHAAMTSQFDRYC